MTRWRRPGAREILLAYLALALASFIAGWLSRLTSPAHPLSSLLGTAFLTWRVSRGGYISRTVLIVQGVLSCAGAVLAVARLWDIAVLALVITSAAQVTLLLSPPVYGRTRRPAPVAARLPGWSWLLRRPPAWILPSGLLAGGLVTLACLGHMDWVTVACHPAGSDSCIALTEGYPLYWLTASQNMPVIFKEALLRDFAQWALAGTSVLYLGWLWFTAPDSRDEQALPRPAAYGFKLITPWSRSGRRYRLLLSALGDAAGFAGRT